MTVVVVAVVDVMIVADAAVMTVVVVAVVDVMIVADAVVMTALQVIGHPLIALQTTGAVNLLP